LPLHQLAQPLGQVRLRLAVSTVSFHSLGNAQFVSDGDVDLANLAALRSAEELGDVQLAPNALAARIATDARPSAEGPPNQRSAFGEEVVN
jgi:hypothetical protein